ncbi:MAG TPA: gliding motility-associated protein GldE [Cyclobacteriaceae bacterium]|nr:gliding motility-associated protein GldE [Cyclobacteriaceae bacterium]
MDDPFPSILILAEIPPVSAGYWLINGVLFITLLIFSALFSGSEVAYFSLTQQDLRDLKLKNDEKSQLVIKLVEAPQVLLSTILILKNLLNITIITLAVYAAWGYWGSTGPGLGLVLLFALAIAFILVIAGEVIPKAYAYNFRIRYSGSMAQALYVFTIILRPFSTALLGISNVIEKRIEKKGYSLSVEELHQALEITTDNTSVNEKDIFRGIVNFGTLTVRQVMQSRMDLTAVDITMDFHELMDKINKSGYSRIPVYKETIDYIEGILYIKDLLSHIDKEEDFKWQALIRKGYFVPENKKVDALLKDFKKRRVHMAIVVDEYGGTSGLVTLEDLIEEIIGEINDEFDDIEDLSYKQIDEYTHIFEGKISLNDFCKKLEVDPQIFDEVKGESESLGGLLLELNARLPKSGSKIFFHPFEFVVMAVDAKRIKKVKVTVQQNDGKNISHNED